MRTCHRREMAIPFALPSEDESEIQGQQLEQLMLDLYAALQQVLRSRNAQQHPSRNRELYDFLWLLLGCLGAILRVLARLSNRPSR